MIFLKIGGQAFYGPGNSDDRSDTVSTQSLTTEIIPLTNIFAKPEIVHSTILACSKEPKWDFFVPKIEFKNVVINSL